ncbi:aminodeoxychorismate synthase component I [Leadbetterella sp. DM7]|uniref:aminodeoxychorismate synthase component I n=1 Tax=Leadbetterella sp. DM7 TaxID=3235085 RepID=UPI00349E619E
MDKGQGARDKVVHCPLSIVHYDQPAAIEFMNRMGQAGRPFLFVISYDRDRSYMVPLEELDPAFIRYDFSGDAPLKPGTFRLQPEKIDFETYRNAFQYVQKNILAGNSFLTNLTASVPVSGANNPEEVFEKARARYKLWIKGQFVCFSPETFITVSETGEVATFPMKGTIDAGVKNAEEILRSDKKELYEHTTIVDLLRNDLSMVAGDVHVKRFQYIDHIRRDDGPGILQMSSEIRGQLPGNWKETLGTWFFELLPAGSICGAPRHKTLEIIKEAEKTLHPNGYRGFYSGVCGVFDGKTLNSAVMIRFIEQTPRGPVFRSGGGITHLSEAEKEYGEIYQKIYVPLG